MTALPDDETTARTHMSSLCTKIDERKRGTEKWPVSECNSNLGLPEFTFATVGRMRDDERLSLDPRMKDGKMRRKGSER